MRIVVAVKYVPDIQSDRGFVDGRVVRTSDDGTLNELDENAVEAALRLVEALGEEDRAASEVVVLTVGPADAEQALRKAYQLGADRAVRVTDDALAGADYFATAGAVAVAVATLAAERPVDLVLTGMAALDGLGSVVPTITSAALGWPAVGLVTAFELAQDASGAPVLRATRELDGATEQVEVPRPAVVSVTDHANDPRFPNFKLIMAARTKNVDVWSLAEVADAAGSLGLDVATLTTPRTRTLSAEPRPERPEPEIVVDKGEGGIALAEYLIRNELV
ncbi:electron transfer flavoprotein subunit beta/FixA family protein [Luteimicrobium subarcticum]|uniref:electron transfer flavoprotein subunit beta/FixA family protein n=1 Tax=Luteimicrobium subarcticum TaxID=620910 RepID=UPI000C248238|nr:electron transfer flavoprotein subunit beta/FixA family protein [Luteimicrobium subarcticum]